MQFEGLQVVTITVHSSTQARKIHILPRLLEGCLIKHGTNTIASKEPHSFTRDKHGHLTQLAMPYLEQVSGEPWTCHGYHRRQNNPCIFILCVIT
jgi:hypothetical protein